jgi:hydroxymethylpyrimidine kinase/phosphomethylpyrimidine kinase
MNVRNRSLPVALTIAGLDPSGGAGVMADVHAFSSFGCDAAVAVTSITFQNDQEVLGAEHLSWETVFGQINAIMRKGNVQAVKVGMLPTAEQVHGLEQLFRAGSLKPPVIDPVIKSTSGFVLADPAVVDETMKHLFPLARLITPNIPEAEQISGLRISDIDGMRRAAVVIRELGTPAVLIKGGHLPETGELNAEAVDLLDDNGHVTLFRESFIPNVTARGTGCSLSAAIAANLAHRKSLSESVGVAKRFVHNLVANRAVNSIS